MVRRVASSVVGLTRMMLCAKARPNSVASCSMAFMNAASIGTNTSTKSSVRMPSSPA